MCTPSQIPYPSVPDVQFTSLSAVLVSNVTTQIPECLYVNHGALDVKGVSYCHVTTHYTHTGKTDNITVDVFLPTDGWNGRMQAAGGGGYTAGGVNFPISYYTMLGAVAEGYSSATTDAGHASLDPGDWVLQSPGNVNTQLLENFGSTSLNELSIIGKAVTESYYGKPPAYSYWTGCSQGGRQGMKLAEKYPTAFDGIAASAPALDFAGIGGAELWPQVIMNEMKQYPKNCEILAITDAFIKHCDGQDGLTDGVVSDPDACQFDPYSLVGNPVNCNDTGTPEVVHISEAAVKVSEATWTGAKTPDGEFLWWGLKRGTRLIDLVTEVGTNPSIATTKCSPDGTCVGSPSELIVQWITLLVKKDPTFDVTTVTVADLQDIFQASMKEYASILNVEPNLDAFREAGGKMMTYHGLADGIIPPDSTRDFFDKVKARDKSVYDYYRVFEAPGLAHCFSGYGGYYPAGIFDALVEWVESGVAPDRLVASTVPQNGTSYEGILCPYPQKPRYNGLGLSVTADNFYCDE
ncbi:tannase and feruloyl esterase [Hypomontagnella submonticulosa]|nr:tannase and feruloyl esterase [Hypomontagnella submonticulosa]